MKRYVISGASSGIGRECSKRLIEDGHQVIMVARRTPSFNGDIPQNSNNVIFFEKDLSIAGSAGSLVNTLEREKLLPIDGFVHCAGVAPLMKIDENNFAAVRNAYEVNLFSFLEMMDGLTNGGGYSEYASVVVMSSVVSLRGSNRQSVYAGTKAALEEAVRCYSSLLASKNVRVNAIVSGAVETELLSRLKTESIGLEDKMKISYPLGIIPIGIICDIIKFLLSSKSVMINGKSVPVDSGYLL